MNDSQELQHVGMEHPSGVYNEGFLFSGIKLSEDLDCVRLPWWKCLASKFIATMITWWCWKENMPSDYERLDGHIDILLGIWVAVMWQLDDVRENESWLVGVNDKSAVDDHSTQTIEHQSGCHRTRFVDIHHLTWDQYCSDHPAHQLMTTGADSTINMLLTTGHYTLSTKTAVVSGLVSMECVGLKTNCL